MKKILIGVLPLILGFLMSSCDGITETPKPSDGPKNSSGAYIINQGNKYQTQVSGSLTVIEYEGNKTFPNVFKNANGRVLGNTPQCGVAYGSKLYIGTSVSSTIEVINRSDFKSVAQINLDGKVVPGTQPRSLVAYEGFVYISLYDGYVAKMDTTDYSLVSSLKVGPNPEIMDVYKGKLYVPNSDGMNYEANYKNGTTYSVIDLKEFKVESTVECPLNPERFISTANTLFLLSKGNYLADDEDKYVPSKVYRIKSNGSSEAICEATLIGKNRCGLYIVNQPFNEPGKIEYKKYYAENNELVNWEFDAPDYINAVAADPVSGDVLVASYVMNGQYPSYIAPGYVNRYSREGEFKARYNVGSGPSAIVFNAD